MITKVLDETGNVIHDCVDQGCDVSWDGFALRDLSAEELYPSGKPLPVGALPVKKGVEVPNAEAPNAGKWEVRGSIAVLK